MPYLREDISRIEKCLFLETGYGTRKALIGVYRNTIAGSLVPENFNEPDPRKVEVRPRKLDDDYIASRTLLSTTDQSVHDSDVVILSRTA